MTCAINVYVVAVVIVVEVASLIVHFCLNSSTAFQKADHIEALDRRTTGSS